MINRSAIAAWLALTSVALAQGGPAVVTTAMVQRGTIAETADLLGTTQPVRHAVIASEVEGLVLELFVRPGNRVGNGEAIGHLSGDLAADEILAQQALVAEVQAQLDALEAGSRPEELAQARAAFDEAKRLREREDERMTTLVERVRKGAEAQETLDDRSALLDAARLREQRLEQAWRLTDAGPRTETIRAARARVARESALLSRLEKEQARRTLRAPFAGVVTALHTEVGQWIARGGAVVELVDISRIEVEVPIPQRFLVGLAPGAEARVDLDAFPDRQTTVARLDRLGAVADLRGRAVPGWIVIENPSGELRAGLSATVSLDVGLQHEAVVVSQDALYTQGGRTFACVVVNGAVEFAYVETGARRAGLVAVRSGLEAGQRVVVRGNERLRPGQAVVEANGSGAGR